MIPLFKNRFGFRQELAKSKKFNALTLESFFQMKSKSLFEKVVIFVNW